jgi:hypothetical protein
MTLLAIMVGCAAVCVVLCAIADVCERMAGKR